MEDDLAAELEGIAHDEEAALRRALAGEEWKCPKCGEIFQGLPYECVGGDEDCAEMLVNQQ